MDYEVHYREHLLPNGDVHTLVEGCKTCESFLEWPEKLGRRELLRIWAKFYDVPGITNKEPRTSLDAEFVSKFERAYSLGRRMGWINPEQSWDALPEFATETEVTA